MGAALFARRPHCFSVLEVSTRGAFVLAVTNEDNTEVEKAADYVVYIPETNKYFTNSLAIIPLQLFGYYIILTYQIKRLLLQITGVLCLILTEPKSPAPTIK